MEQQVSARNPGFLRRRLEGREDLQRVIANTGWLLADKVVRMGVGVFVSVWIARYLGPEQFGLLGFVTAFVALFTAVATLGLERVVIREIVRDPDSEGKSIGSAFLLRLAGGMTSCILAVSLITLIRPEDPMIRVAVAIVSVTLVLRSIEVIKYWFDAKIRSKYTVIAENAAFFIIAAIKIALILIKAPIIYFFWAMSIEVSLLAIGYIIAYKKVGEKIYKWKPQWNTSIYLIKNSWPLMVASFATIASMKIDHVMIGNILTIKDVGIYVAAARISEIWYFIPTAIVTSVMPIIISSKKNNITNFISYNQNLLNILFCFAFVIAIIFTFISPFFINLIYGSAYIDSSLILSIHVWSGIFVFLGLGITPMIISEDLQMWAMYRSVTGVLLNIILNLLLIPTYGVFGAAVSLLVTNAIGYFFINFLGKKTRHIFYMQLKSMYYPLTFIKSFKNGS
jgi:polysaccharide transporter, PST family